VAVSFSIATWGSSPPFAWRLYLFREWDRDGKRRRRVAGPEEVEFQTTPHLHWSRSTQAVEQGVPSGVVVADAGYRIDGQFCGAVAGLRLK